MDKDAWCTLASSLFINIQLKHGCLLPSEVVQILTSIPSSNAEGEGFMTHTATNLQAACRNVLASLLGNTSVLLLILQ